MRFRGWRARTVTTLIGPVTLWRPYWHCAACGTGVAPTDARWALPADGASLAVQTLAALVGTVQPFRQAAEMLQRLAGLTVSARSIETWTERLGQAYTPPGLASSAPGPAAEVLVLQADAVMTCFHDGWHEEKVAMAWRIHDGVVVPARYVTGEGSWEAFTPALVALARREGSRRARRLVCVADGAHAIWRVLTRCYPVVQQRAKLAGMRWSHAHLQTVLAARCAFFSGDWDLACAQYENAA